MVTHEDPWSALTRELDAWSEAGRSATLWWRDDDCIEPTAALDRLLALAQQFDLPLALAVVPARLSAALPQRLADHRGACVLQHGYAHRNHAPAERKKQELDPDRSLAAVMEELQRGAARLTGHFPMAGPVQRLPVLVPPWNRIAPSLIPELPGLGYRGLSADGPRPSPTAAPGLQQANTHVDLLRALRKQGAASAEQVVGDLVEHLAARRLGKAEATEPSGLLTHHLAHDPGSWALLERLLAALREHGASRFLDAAEVFPDPATDDRLSGQKAADRTAAA